MDTVLSGRGFDSSSNHSRSFLRSITMESRLEIVVGCMVYGSLSSFIDYSIEGLSLFFPFVNFFLIILLNQEMRILKEQRYSLMGRVVCLEEQECLPNRFHPLIDQYSHLPYYTGFPC